MKKLAMAVVAVLVVGMVASWAASVITVGSHAPIDIKGKTSAKGTIANKDLLPVGSTNGVLEVIEYTDSAVGSNVTLTALGTVTIPTNGVTNAVFSATVQRAFIDSKGKAVAILKIDNAAGTTNGAALLTGKVDDKKGTVSFKAVGVWVDGTSAFSASIKNAKAAKAPKGKKP